MRYKIGFWFACLCWIATSIDQKKDQQKFNAIALEHNSRLAMSDSINEFRFDSLCCFYEENTIIVNLISQ